MWNWVNLNAISSRMLKLKKSVWMSDQLRTSYLLLMVEMQVICVLILRVVWLCFLCLQDTGILSDIFLWNDSSWSLDWSTFPVIFICSIVGFGMGKVYDAIIFLAAEICSFKYVEACSPFCVHVLLSLESVFAS